ncbi:MAG TPA: hypothetical protein VN231_12105 [Allosphingosinicella sp.]|nr:hypothetical protein [Allosphingosinicella sp.]
MASEAQQPYPGEMAAPEQVLLLADEYRKAAHLLLQLGRPGGQLSRAPFRLVAIHAIELYLNALLLHRGHAPSQVRGLQHDLAQRAELAVAAGLKLRSRTAAHLTAIARNREYLVIRYGPELNGTSSQINRLTATLDELAKKVTKELAGSPRGLEQPDSHPRLALIKAA